MKYKPLSDEDLGQAYTPRTIELCNDGEYMLMLEEQCRRANRLAAAVRAFCDGRAEYCIPGYTKFNGMVDALRAYEGTDV